MSKRSKQTESLATDTTARVILPRYVREQIARAKAAQKKAGAPAEQKKSE